MADALPASESPREVELTLVTMEFRSSKPELLMPVLAKYVVVS